MKKITIISLGDETGKSLKLQLESILKKNTKIEYYSIYNKITKIIFKRRCSKFISF